MMAMVSAPVSRGMTAVLSALAFAYWLFAHRYSGIWHDATIYNLMAAARINPTAYANDLFFIFGSQDAFSLYSPLFAQMIDWLDIDLANRAMVLTGAMLWVAALILLGRSLKMSAIPLFAAVLLCVVMRQSYSLNGETFLLNENFATARTLAFPLALMGIALDIGGCSRTGLAVSFVATLLHPLLGIWALLTATVRRLSDRVLFSIGALVICGSAVIGFYMPPMDALWEARVRMTAPDVFAGTWNSFAADRVVFWLSACWLGGRFGSTAAFRRLCLTVALLAAWAVLASQISSYWKPLISIMQIQPWRALWLAVVLGMFALVDSAWQLFVNGRHYRPWILLATIALFTLREHAGLLLLLLVLFDTTGIWHKLHESRAITLWPLIGVSWLGIMLLLPGALVQSHMDALTIGNPWLVDSPLTKWFVFGGGGISFAILGWLATKRAGISCLLAGTLLLLAFALPNWDARVKQRRQMEAMYSVHGYSKHIFLKYIRAGDIVAGVDRAPFIWFVLGTSGYASAEQATGSVFSREKTVESLRRLRRFAVAAEMRTSEKEYQVWQRILDKQSVDARYPSATLATSHAEITIAGIGYLCRDPLLDWLVSARGFEVAGKPTWLATEQFSGERDYLYDCRSLRAEGNVI